MTTERITRCSHCLDHYTHYPSGGAPDAHRDSRYCPACLGAITAALENVPRKYESRWVPVAEIPRFRDVTLDMLLAWEKEILARPLPIQRIWPGLWNLDTGDHFDIRGVPGRGEYQGILFQVGTWGSTPIGYEIKVEMEYDAQTGEPTGNLW
jgi:hypothetical protein